MFSRSIVTMALVAIALPSSTQAQYGKTFASAEVRPPTINATYRVGNGQLVVLLETQPANDEAYLFLDEQTGAKMGALRLDAHHGAMTSPGGGEILVAGTQQTADLEPVYFAGRYVASTLVPIEERQIGVDKNSGYGLSGEVSPDGTFVYRGVHSPSQVNVVAKYGPDFVARWGTALTYQGRFEPTGMEAFPLANGSVGFLVVFTELRGAELVRKNVVGLLDGMDGRVLWSGVVEAVQAGLVLDDVRHVFGQDGSLMTIRRSRDVTQPLSDTMRLARVRPDGILAYSRQLTVPGANLEWQYYLGERTLVYGTFKEGQADRILFIVLDGGGNVESAATLNCSLRGSGTVKLTAAQREGTDVAFLRLECGFTTRSPEQTLARLDLRTGGIQMKRLPTGIGIGTYEVVTTPSGDYLSPYNNQPGLAAVTSTIAVSLTNPLGGAGTVGVYELPANGGFPECIALADSTVEVGMAVAPQVTDASLIDLADVATGVPHPMAGMVAPLLRPTVAALDLTETVVCEDDGTGVSAPILEIVRSGSDQVEIRIPTAADALYRLETTQGFGAWTEIETRAGDGAVWMRNVGITGDSAFFRVSVEN